jgi:hypothetical protein
MRYMAESRQIDNARQLAEDAIAFYRDHWSQWNETGLGGEHAVNYYSEAMAMLGRGLPVQVQFKINEHQGQFAGVFEDEDEAARILRLSLKGEMDKKRSKYWA